jgi:integrase/recombinase XerD
VIGKDTPDDAIVVPTPQRGALALEQPSVQDVWDEALTHVLADNSRRTYRTALESFARFVLTKAGTMPPEDGKEAMLLATPLLPEVSSAHVTQFREELRGEGLAATTINVRLAAVMMLFQRMLRLKLIDENPATPELVSRMKTSNVSGTEGLSRQEAEDLLNIIASDRSLRGLRDLALFLVLFHNGLRRSEVANLLIQNFRMVNDTPTYEVTVKGGKTLVIEIIPVVWQEVKRWLDAAAIGHGPVFRRLRRAKGGTYKLCHGGLTANGIYSIIKARVKESRIKKNIHPHSLRHTYATLALLGGVPLQDVQVSMGHSSPNTTFRYFRAIEQVGRSPGRALGLNWQQKGTKEEPT